MWLRAGLPSIVSLCVACEHSECQLRHLYASNARTRENEDQKGVALGRMIKLNRSLVRCCGPLRTSLKARGALNIGVHLSRAGLSGRISHASVR
eukprot:COSAG01_NODE_9539_length_2415_cov_1.990069_4_plen_94_part_00